MVFLFVVSQVGEIQNEWLQELYKVSLGLVGHAFQVTVLKVHYATVIHACKQTKTQMQEIVVCRS